MIGLVDRVFGCDSSTRQVYEEGAKEVALSVVSGINGEYDAHSLNLILVLMLVKQTWAEAFSLFHFQLVCSLTDRQVVERRTL